MKSSYLKIAITLLMFFNTTKTSQETILKSEEDKNLKKLQMSFEQAINESCNSALLISYGLEGLETPKLEQHKLCPKVNMNCCSATDNDKALSNWNLTYKQNIKFYYDTFLMSVKYLLGFSNEIYHLAKSFNDSTLPECKAASEKIIKLEMDQILTKTIYKQIEKAINEMINLRKGFLCSICDAKSQLEFQQAGDPQNRVNDKIYLSKSFCEKIVDQNILSKFYQMNYLKSYLDNSVVLMNCKNPKKFKVFEYAVGNSALDTVKNCYYKKNSNLFFYCQNFCSGFHLTKPNALHDGEILGLKQFVDLFIHQKKDVFENPDANIIDEDSTVAFMEDMLNFYYKQDTFLDYTFFPANSASSDYNLDKYGTDVLYFGGMDPYFSGENNIYPFLTESVMLMNVFMTALWLFISF